MPRTIPRWLVITTYCSFELPGNFRFGTNRRERILWNEPLGWMNSQFTLVFMSNCKCYWGEDVKFYLVNVWGTTELFKNINCTSLLELCSTTLYLEAELEHVLENFCCLFDCLEDSSTFQCFQICYTNRGHMVKSYRRQSRNGQFQILSPESQVQYFYLTLQTFMWIIINMEKKQNTVSAK